MSSVSATPDPSTPGGDSIGGRTLPPTARGRRRRESLLTAARKVFERLDYFDARVVDICEEARCAIGSFYTYFDSKDHVLMVLLGELDEVMMRPTSTIEEPRHGDPRWSIEAANRAYFEAYSDNAGLMLCFEQAAVVDDVFRTRRIERAHQFIRRNARGIRHLQARGLVDPTLDPELAARALSGMVSRLALSTYVLGDPVPIEDLVSISTTIWLNALGIGDGDDAGDLGGESGQ